MDDIDRHILTTLQHDARTPYAELARRVGLTAPAVAERIRKLEADGVVSGYHAHIDPASVGRQLSAFLRVTTTDEHATELQSMANDSPAVSELHRVAGSEGFVIKVAVHSLDELDELISRFARFGQVTTSIVLSSPVRWREMAV